MRIVAMSFHLQSRMLQAGSTVLHNRASVRGRGCTSSARHAFGCEFVLNESCDGTRPTGKGLAYKKIKT